MSAETEDKKEIEKNLMDDNNQNDKSYGTEERVILPTGQSTHDTEAGIAAEKSRIKRNQSLLKRMQSYETQRSHLSFLNTIVSFVFDTSIVLISLFINLIVLIINLYHLKLAELLRF